MKYVIYLRVSTKDRQDITTQLDKCLKFLRSRDNTDFKYVVYSDKMSSGKPTDKRVGFIEAMHSLEAGDVLVSTKIDRLSRNSLECQKIKQDLEIIGASILLIDQPGIDDTVMFGLYAAMAEKEREVIRSRIKDNLSIKKERLEKCGRYIPFGYELHPTELVLVKGADGKRVQKLGKLIPKPQEQTALLQMQEWFDFGVSYREIGRRLDKMGIATREGGSWHPNSVSRILARTGRKKFHGRSHKEKASLLNY